MTQKIKNGIVFVIIAAILILVYFFLIRRDSSSTSLIVSPVSSSAPTSDAATLDKNSLVAQDFLSLLLSVKSIKLNDAIFSDSAFINLHDSSITLIPDGTEGRINPFAALGTDKVPASTSDTDTNTPASTTP